VPVYGGDEDERVGFPDLLPDGLQVVLLDAVSFPALAPAPLAGLAGLDIHVVEVDELHVAPLRGEAV
jgi:hypothetical protein